MRRKFKNAGLKIAGTGLLMAGVPIGIKLGALYSSSPMIQQLGQAFPLSAFETVIIVGAVMFIGGMWWHAWGVLNGSSER